MDHSIVQCRVLSTQAMRLYAYLDIIIIIIINQSINHRL